MPDNFIIIIFIMIRNICYPNVIEFVRDFQDNEKNL